MTQEYIQTLAEQIDKSISDRGFCLIKNKHGQLIKIKCKKDLISTDYKVVDKFQDRTDNIMSTRHYSSLDGEDGLIEKEFKMEVVK